MTALLWAWNNRGLILGGLGIVIAAGLGWWLKDRLVEAATAHDLKVTLDRERKDRAEADKARMADSVAIAASDEHVRTVVQRVVKTIKVPAASVCALSPEAVKRINEARGYPP